MTPAEITFGAVLGAIIAIGWTLEFIHAGRNRDKP